MRLPRTIWLGPKSNGKCPYKEQKRGSHRGKRRGPMKTEEEIRVGWPQVKDAWSHQELGEAGKYPPLEPLEGAQPS